MQDNNTTTQGSIRHLPFAERLRIYRQRHTDKIKRRLETDPIFRERYQKKNHEYYLSKKDYFKQYYQRNKERMIAQAKRYYHENKVLKRDLLQQQYNEMQEREFIKERYEKPSQTDFVE